MRAKSSGKNNYNRSPSKRSRTSPIPMSSFLSLSLSPSTSPCSLSHSYPGTTSHIRGSTILYKILAVVILGALYYYFFITMRHTAFKGSNLCLLRARLDRRTTILTTYYSLFSLARCTRPFRITYVHVHISDSDRTVTLATFE